MIRFLLRSFEKQSLPGLFLFCLLYSGSLWAQGDNSVRVTGESIQFINNKGDIYLKKNRDARQEMIEAAVFDAIDKGASQRVSSIVEHMNYSNSVSNSFEDVFEDYLSSSLKQMNVEWVRNSSYKFSRMEIEKGDKGRKWKCIVEGTVRNLDPTRLNPPSEKPKTDNDYYITRKSYNIVHINAGSDDDIQIGDKFVAFKYKGKKALTGINMKAKAMGLISITNVEGNYSEGRILRGIYGVKEAHQAKKYNFKKSRSGLEYKWGSSYEQINTTDIGDLESSLNTTSHSLYYYYFSYISRVGFKLGGSYYDINKEYTDPDQGDYKTDSTAVAFSPEFNLNYSIGLVPDFVFLVPNATLGYLFVMDNKESIFDKPDGAWDVDLILEADMSVHLRLWSFDFIGGIGYKYINDYPELSNFYPHFGVAYNFVKYAKKALLAE
jgi:hypothetical protein